MAQVLRGEQLYDLARLSREIDIARNLLEFDEGPYRNAISLPSADQLYAPYRTHHNNVPFSGALDVCPYMKDIFDSFQARKQRSGCCAGCPIQHTPSMMTRTVAAISPAFKFRSTPAKKRFS